MALSKNDLKEISKVVAIGVSSGINALAMPHFENMYSQFDKINRKLELHDKRFDIIDESIGDLRSNQQVIIQALQSKNLLPKNHENNLSSSALG